MRDEGRGGRRSDAAPAPSGTIPRLAAVLPASSYLMRNGITSRATMLMTLIIGLIAGPAVSL